MNATGTDGTGAVAQLLQMQQQQQPLPDEEYSSSARPRWKKPKRGVSELVSRAVVCMCWFASDQLCAGSFFFPKRSAFFSLGSAAVSGCACHAMPCHVPRISVGMHSALLVHVQFTLWLLGHFI